jgi:hypothetical protein
MIVMMVMVMAQVDAGKLSSFAEEENGDRQKRKLIKKFI